jgi:hypothetical protein
MRVIFFGQLCDITKVAIIHKKILAKSGHKQMSKKIEGENDEKN